ncbi:DMT family transporter [candidate division KSB1 bacterium]|nr:DMT family transporter [candidate division KSB1 bacterium]
MENYIGETAALATAFCWSFTSIFFTIASKKLGSLRVNFIRLVLATLLLIGVHLLVFGTALPIEVERYRWFWLGLSGFIGLVIGDSLLFKAFSMIGARVSMLLMSLVPIMSTMLAWLMLGELLSLIEIAAIVLTVAGIAWVVAERNTGNDLPHGSGYIWGILFGLGGAVGQSIALITAKKGMIGLFSPLSSNLIRMFTAAFIFMLITLIRERSLKTLFFWSVKSVRLPLIGGSVFGPFIGVWLSLIAIKYANVGIASTLMALPPIFLIPLSYWIFHEKISWRSLSGTLLVFLGVSFIFLT